MKTKLKILHLEDVPTDAELVERELKKGNIQFEKIVVANKIAFQKALIEFVPDIIIADHTLPSFDSLEAMGIMKHSGIKIPIILVTATVSDEYAVDIMKAGADDYILKDRLHRLPQAVLNAMEKFRREEEREHMIYTHAHLAAVVNASNDGIISKTLDGTISSWNIGAEKLLGYSAAETFGENISLIIPTDCLQEESEFMDIIKRGESVQNFETVRLTKNGIRVNVSLTISPLKDDIGKVFGAAVIVYNITDRKKAEQIIYDSEEKYRSFFENSTDGILLTVTDGRILSANTAACAIFRMTEEEICKMGRFGLVDTTDPRMAAALKERQRTGKTKAEVTLIRKNGEKFPGELTSVVYKNTNGEERTSMIVRDISERKYAQELLIESEQFNKGILASLSSHIAVIDNTGNIITVNKAWEDFGIKNGITSLDRISTGSNYFDVCKQSIENGDSDAAQALAGIQSVLKKEQEQFEMEYACHSLEQQRWFNLSVTKFGEDDSKIVISHQNITERKIVENNLSDTSVELQKTLSELNKILDASLDVICTINADGEFVNVSAASQQVWGYTPEELIGTKFMNFVYAEDVDMTSKAAEKNFNGLQVPLFENKYLHKSGRVVPILWSVNWDEKLQLTICIAKDVTEKKGLEKAVETERDQFFEMFSKAPTAIGMLKGANHVFEMANPLYLQFIGKKDVIGKTVAEVLPELIEQGFVSILDHVYRTGESNIGTETLVEVDKDGNGELTDLYMNFAYQAYRNGKGEIEGIFFFINDITKQILSRKEIEKSEKQYRQIVETTQEGIWQLDENNKIIFINKKISEILEYAEEEMLGKKHFSFMEKDEKRKTLIAIARRKKGIPESYKLTFISKTGKQILTNVSATPIFDDLGNYKGSLGMISDITEKKQLEDLLEKSNRLARIGSWEIDVDKETVYWSDITKEIREAEPDFIPDLSTGIGYFREGTNRKTISQRLQQCIDTGIPWDEELQITTFKGNLKWVRTIGEAEFVQGKCSKVYGSLQDITERKIAEKETARLSERLQMATQAASVGIWEYDILRNSLIWDDNMYKLYGITPDKFSGAYKAWEEGLHPDDLLSARKDMQMAIRGEKEFSTEFRVVWPDKSIHYIKANALAKRDGEGDAVRMTGINWDITKQIEEQQQKEKMISDIVQRNSDLEQFSYIVSHNLRAPVANILGLGDLMGQEDYTPEVKNDFLEALLDNVKRLDIVISDLNSILQIKAEMDGKKQTVILNDLVDSIKSSIQNLIEKEKVQIITYFDVPIFHTVQSLLHSIIYNLIENSIKYRQLGIPPQIEISSESKEGSLIITFEDNGLGIDLAKERKQVFGLYKRFHHHVEGKGMGLFLVKTQVDLLGGKISIESEVNRGTKFTLTFKETTFNYITEDEK